MRYTIIGTPRILKNSKRIVHFGGSPRLIPSKLALKAEKGAVTQLCPQRRGTTWDGPIHVKFTFYGSWKSGGGNVPDLSNLVELPQDCLTKAGIITDDRIIESLDGTRRVCMCDTCDKRKKYVRGEKAGQYKADCEKVKQCTLERTEIEILRLD